MVSAAMTTSIYVYNVSLCFSVNLWLCVTAQAFYFHTVRYEMMVYGSIPERAFVKTLCYGASCLFNHPQQQIVVSPESFIKY